MLLWSKKYIKGEKHIDPMNFAFQGIANFRGKFLPNGLPERYWYISKSRWDVQYLEVC